MTGYSGSKDPKSANNVDWCWLQQRLHANVASAVFSNWMSEQLARLEREFSGMITNKSRNRSLRIDLDRNPAEATGE